MSLLVQKIKLYIEAKSILQLQKETSVGSSLIYSLIREEKRTYYPSTLEKLYRFFKIPKDTFFKEKTNEYKGRYDPLGQFFYKKRLQMGLSRSEVSRMIKGTARHLRRIESGRVKYSRSSYYYSQLLDLYNISEEEKMCINEYSENLKKLLSIVRP